MKSKIRSGFRKLLQIVCVGMCVFPDAGLARDKGDSFYLGDGEINFAFAIPTLEKNGEIFWNYEELNAGELQTSWPKLEAERHIICPKSISDSISGPSIIYAYSKSMSHDVRCINVGLEGIKNRGDLLQLLALISSTISHGKFDNQVASYEKKAALRQIVLTCGPANVFGQQILNSFGFVTRRVYTLTEQPFKLFLDGHAITEIYDPWNRTWFLFDFDRAVLFVDPDLQPITAYSLATTPLNKVKFLQFVEKDTDFLGATKGTYLQFKYSNLYSFYSRAIGSVAIQTSPTAPIDFLANNSRQDQRVLKHGDEHAVLSDTDFKQKYYGNG